MVENISTRAVIKDKAASLASDLVSGFDKGLSSLGRQRPSDDNPVQYKVTHKGGALVRAGQETSSPQVHQLSAGEVVTIVDLVGRRARIVSPVEGWVSTDTKDGVQIMKPCALQRRAAANEAFENNFERKFASLKAKQRGSQGGYDPRAETGGGDYDRGDSWSYDRHDRRKDRDSPSPRRRSDSDSDYDDRDRRRNRDTGRRDDRDRKSDRDGGKPKVQLSSERGGSSADAGGCVPKLSAPGQGGGPTILSPPPGSRASNSAPTGGSLFDDEPRPAPAASTGGTGGGVDLLGFGDGPSGGVPTQPQEQAFDPFSIGPPAAAPAAQPFPSSGGGAGDWDAFQSGGAPNNAANAFQPQFNQMAQPTPQPQMGYQALNPMMGQQMGQPQMSQQQMGQQPMGWGMNQPAAAMPGQGWGGGASGAGYMGNQMQQMPNMSMGMTGQMGQSPMVQPQMGAAGFNAFGGSPATGQPNMGMGMGMQQQTPQMNAGMQGMQTGPSGGKVDDLMSQAMQGVANMSFEQRQAATKTQTSPSGVSMNMMQGMR